MNEPKVVTTAGAALALTCVVGSVLPAVGAWLDWAMGWVLGVGAGVPLVVWLGRGAAAEIGLAVELVRSRPASGAPARKVEEPTR